MARRTYEPARIPTEVMDDVRAWQPVAIHITRKPLSLGDTIKFLADAAREVYPELAPKQTEAQL